jgi:hypothetical protein
VNILARNYYAFDHRPLKDDWGVRGAVLAIVDDWNLSRANQQSEFATSRKGDRPTAGVVVNLPYLNPSSIALYSRLLSEGRAGPPLIDVLWLVDQSQQSRIGECDYLIARTGLESAEWLAALELYAQDLIRGNPQEFIQVASFAIPVDNAEAVVYRINR